MSNLLQGNLTLSGRTDGYTSTLANLNGHWLLGLGPSITTVNNVENTLLTLFSYFGVLGILIFGFCAVGMYSATKNSSGEWRSNSRAILATFLVAGLGESVMDTSITDVGISYILLSLCIARKKSTEGV